MSFSVAAVPLQANPCESASDRDTKVMTNSNYTLITGASSGIGREIARHLSKRQKLILNGRDERRLEETRSSCVSPEEHLIWRMELDKTDRIFASLAEFLQTRSAFVDYYVHCAGMMKILPIRTIDLAHVYDVLNVNFVSAFALVNTLVKKKVNSQQLKAVVFVSSIASRFGAKGFSVYSASKGALDSFMKSMAMELAPAVRVNSVLSGGIKTEMTETIFANPDMEQKFREDYPLGLGRPADIANAVEFLLSEEARWITGQEMIVDGGRTVNITA